MNDRGFMTLTLLISLPLILSILAVVGGCYLLLKEQSRSLHECRLSLLESQQKVAQALNELLDLNPQAAALRLRRQAAQSAVLASAGVPLAREAAQLELQKVVAEQTLLASRQRILIAQARFITQSAKTRAQSRIKNSHSLSTSLRFIASANQAPASFEVIARPLGSLTPDYVPATNFSQRQQTATAWSFDIERLLPSWLMELLRLPTQAKLVSSGHCSATLRKGTRTWEAKLTRDKW